MQRREFISKTGLGLVSMGVALPFWQNTQSDKSTPVRMPTRVLGRTGMQIPLLSFGVMNSDSPTLLRQALDMGVKHLDTAWSYLRGNSERVIGTILKERNARPQVYVATKLRFARDREKNVFIAEPSGNEPAPTPENFQKQLAESLQRLQTDYLDILYLHSCFSPAMVTYEPLLKLLVKAKEAGNTRFIGISTHKDEPHVIRAAVDAGYDVVLTAYNFAQNYRDEVKKAIAYAAEKGVGIIAMKTQAGGEQRNEGLNIDHRAALKWVLTDENVCTAIPGMTSFNQLEMNLAAVADLRLGHSEKNALNANSLNPANLYCQGCRSCVSTCPQRVEIPSLMRAYMYLAGYGNRTQAEVTLAQLPPAQSLDSCRFCSGCSAVCRYGKRIPSRVAGLLSAGI